MAQSFLNPSQFSPRVPEYSGFLGGIVRGNRNDDYEKLLADQLELQKMGLEDTRIDLSEKQADLPIKALEREGKEATLKAKKPYLEKLVIGEAEDKLGTYDQNAKKRPLELRQLIADVTGKEKEMDWQKRLREASMMKEFIPQAKALGGERGAAWMREQIKKAKAIGYDLPDELADPTQWGRYESGLVNTIEHLRQLEIEAKKDAASIEIARMREAGENARNNARISAQRDSERLSGTNAIPIAIRTLSDPKAPPERKEWAESMLKWTAQQRAVDLAQRELGNEMQNNPRMVQATPQQKEALFQQAYERNLRLTLSQFGLASPPPQVDPRAAGGQIRQPGQPAKSQDGWGIRALP